MKSAGLTVLLLGAAACNPLAFNDLADETWVDSTDKPDDVRDGYASALAYGGSGGSGAGIVAISNAPPFVVLIDYDGGGDVEKLHEEVRQGLADAEQLPDRPALATLPSAWGTDAPSAFLGVTSGSQSYIMPLQAQTLDFSGSLVRLMGSENQAVAIAAGEAIDSGNGDDLVAATGEEGDRVYLVANYTVDVNAVSAACQMDDPLSVAIDFDGEILVGSPEGVRRLTGVNIPEPANPDDPPPPCSGGMINAPDVIAGFGQTIATGDLDGDDFPDIAVAAPESGIVLVSFGLTPSEWTQIDAPDGSETFGAALAVGDLDHDGVSELVVGDPAYSEEVESGGAAHVYHVASGDPELVTSLFDIDPEKNQRFGQSVAVLDFDGDASKQILAVGAKNEVFTYFQVVPGDDQDVRH